MTHESGERGLEDAVKEAIADIGYHAVGSVAAALGDYGVYLCMHRITGVRISHRYRAKILKTWRSCCTCNPAGYPCDKPSLEHRLFRGRS